MISLPYANLNSGILRMAGKLLLQKELFWLKKYSKFSNGTVYQFAVHKLYRINGPNGVCCLQFHQDSSCQYQVRKAQEKQITNANSKGEVSFPKKVVEAGKDATYLGIIIGGIAITGFIFYMIGSELFSSQSPSVIFGKALKQCQRHPEVQDELGDGIKGRGEMNRRGRARHVSHAEFEREGVKHMRLMFHLKGSIREGTAHLELKKNDRGKYEVRYLFVEVDKYPYKTIIVEDNR